MSTMTDAVENCPRCHVRRGELPRGGWCDTCGYNPEHEDALWTQAKSSFRNGFFIGIIACSLGLILSLLSCPAQAQEPPDPSPIAAAGWCALVDGEEDEDDPGCDAGLAGALYRWERASLVAAIGSETVGLGGAWTLWVSDGGTAFAVAGGVIAPWDGEGIHVENLAPALGATLSWGRRGR